MADSSSQFQATDSPVGSEFPFSGSPQFAKTSETVINPEGKPPASDPGSSHFTRKTDPELQRALFPDLSLLEAGELPPSPSGLKLAHFEIVDRIGSGGMGSVFLALDLHLQRYVALKILAPSQAREPNAIQRFLNEARSAARLDYDGIARVHYYGEDRGFHFIAFEYVTGTNVRDLIMHSGPLNPADAINFTLQVAHALKHTSAAGVVHRDIKPSNIIVNPAGRAKLVDLGLARKESSGSMEDLTAAGTTLGTFDYISPEQAQDPRNVDVRSDIYSLGCTLYHMLTGEPPYPQGTLAQKLLDHQQSHVPNPAERNRRVPIHLAAVTQKMMASDPKKRYQSPESLIRDLLAVANDQGLRGVTPEGLVWSGGVSQPRHQFLIKYGGWMAAVATLLLIVYAMEWIDPWQPGSPPNGAGNRSVTATESTSRSDSNNGNSSALPEEQQNRVEVADNVGGFSATSDVSQQLQGAIEHNNADMDNPEFGSLTSDALRKALESSGESNPLPKPMALQLFPDETSAVQKDASWQGPPFPFPAVPGAISQEVVKNDNALPAPLPDNIKMTEPPATTGVTAGPFVLLSAGTTKDYATLEAACANARTGSIIELRYDGILPNHSEKPITINRQLTIKAAQNYQPVVEFSSRLNPDESDTRMIAVQNGSLKLVGVHLHLHVNHDVSYPGRDAWTVFSLQDSDQLSLKNVTVTIENPQRRPAVMFEVARSAGGGPEMPERNPGTTSNPTPFSLAIDDSFLRGECQACIIKTVNPGQIRIDGSVIAAENSLLLNMGANDTVDELDELEFSMAQTTVITGMSPFRFETGEASPRSLLHTSITCEDSMFVLSQINAAPFMAMSGDTNPSDLRDAVSWNGRKNFYHGFSVFRTITDSGGSSELPNLDFYNWTLFWSQKDDSDEIQTTSGEVPWSTPWGPVSFSSLTADQLQINMNSVKQQDLLATNGTIVGAELSQLPSPPRRTVPVPDE